MKYLVIIPVLAISVTVWAFNGDMGGADPNGSSEKPYLIQDLDDFFEFAANPAYWAVNMHTQLTCNLDFSETASYPKAPIAPDIDTDAADFQGTGYAGTFDGSGNKILHFSIRDATKSNGYQGLFGHITADGHVKNLILENCSVFGDRYRSFYVGGLVGYNEGSLSHCSIVNNESMRYILGDYVVGGLVGYNNGGSIRDCSSTTIVNGYYDVGGMAGYNNGGTIVRCHADISISGSIGVGGLVASNRTNGMIIDCHTTGTVSGSSSVGGLAGYNEGVIIGSASNITAGHADSSGVGGLVGNNEFGRIENCFSHGEVEGNYCVGGLVGRNEASSSTIDQCYSHCTVDGSAESWHLGGLVGRNEGLVRYSYAQGAVTGTSEAHAAGGLVGHNQGGNDYLGSIEQCYATGAVTSGTDSQSTGGLVGSNDWGSISRCYSTGRVDGDLFVGGLVGYSNSGTAVDSFWDRNRSMQSISAGGTPKTTLEMWVQSTFTEWDFVGESNNGNNEIWRMCADDIDYPRLSWQYARNGDFACNDGVDLLDMQLLAEHWLTSETNNPAVFNYAGDANGDREINFEDFSALSENW